MCFVFAAATVLFAQNGFSDILDTIALSEMNTIADAEALAEINTGYYFSLENLDDLTDEDATITYDFIGDGGGTPVLDPRTARFRPDRIDMIHDFPRWTGPYITYQYNNTDYNDIFDYDRGTPLDPWGFPYLLFSPAGLVQPPKSITDERYGDVFDRWTIVSGGSNRLVGDGDDLFVFFGGAPTALSLTSASPSPVYMGGTLTLKGYNFGTTQGSAEILFNGAVATDGILSWSDTRITKRIVPGDPAGEVTLAIRRDDTTTTPPLTITVISPAAAASPWRDYR